MDSEELEQQELVYITNLKTGLQKDGMRQYDEEGPDEKKPAVEKQRYHYDIPRKKEKMRKLWSQRKWHSQTLGITFS